jgi:hypothetical protein
MGRSQDARPELASDRLFIVVPKILIDEEITDGGHRAGGLVGLILRAGEDKPGEEPGLASPAYTQILEDLNRWLSDSRALTAEIGAETKEVAASGVAPHVQTINYWVKTLRDRLAHRGDVRRDDFGEYLETVVGHARDIDTTDDFPKPESLTALDALIESTQAQLRVMRSANAAAHREQVTLQTASGPLVYTLPFSRADTYDSATVGRILSPTGKTHRSIAQHRRRAHELLGIKVGNQYLHPKFQIDPVRHEIRPIVAYANRALECDADPWGTLDWWYSGDEALAGRRPVDMLDTGELSEKLVDFAIARSSQGMD